MNRRTPALVVAVALLGLLTAACGVFGSGNGSIRITASFDDVGDLVRDHSVRFNDFVVGRIQNVELDEDNRARVTMSIQRRHQIPANIRAEIAQTSVLGERYVALVPSGDETECCLTDGTEIEDTAVRTDLEDLIASGSDLLAEVSSEAVATTIRTGAEAFGGREQLIGAFIDDVNALVSTFEENSDDLLALIDSLDNVTAAYAPNAPQNAAALTDLRTAAAALEELDEQLLDTLDDVSALSGEATDFLREHQDEFRNLVRRLRKVLQEIEEANGEVVKLFEVGEPFLENLVKGAFDIRNAERLTEAQVWLDSIICGVDDGPETVSRCSFDEEGEP